MAKSDCVVIWGTNAVATQVNVMTHAIRARKERGAKIVAIDIYETETMRQADLALRLRPGTDGALACAVMHVLFRDGLADRDFLERYADAPDELEAHLQTRDPAWAARSPASRSQRSRPSRRWSGKTKRTFFRLGYGFSRQRNGAVEHARGALHPRRHRRLGARGRRRVPRNSGVFKLRQDHDRGSRRRAISGPRASTSRASAPSSPAKPRR